VSYADSPVSLNIDGHLVSHTELVTSRLSHKRNKMLFTSGVTNNCYTIVITEVDARRRKLVQLRSFDRFDVCILKN